MSTQTPFTSIVACVSEGPLLQQREVMNAGSAEDTPGSIEFAIWSEDNRIAQFTIPRGLWNQFKEFGDHTLAKFDAAKA